MTGPAQPASNVLQRARQRLLRLGLTDEHVLSLTVPASTSFDPVQLDPVNADPHFAPIVQRVLRFLRGGRGLSIAVADDDPAGSARVHTAVQLASGLARQGIQVVIADMDFRNPGLQGLVADPHAEGIIDMVRFGRSCRSVLQKPVEAGPALLAAGSFPMQSATALDEDAVRSILHRVSLHCELALYVTPLLPDDATLNPVVRLCEHVVLVQSVSEQSVDIVERIQLMQEARLHVAGVVLFDAAAAHEAHGATLWQPGPFGKEPSPSTPEDTPPAPSDTAFPAIGVPPPGAGTPAAVPTPETGIDVPVEPPAVPPAAGPESPPAPPADTGPAPAMPHIPWTPRESTPTGTPPPASSEEEVIPEIHLPDEPTGRRVPETRTVPTQRPQPPMRAEGHLQEKAEPTEMEESPVESPAGRGSPGIDRLWSEPPGPEPQEPLEEAAPSPAEARRGAFDTAEFEDAETEFAYDDGSNWSKTPLYILITLLVLIGGFFGWALWTKRGIEQQVGDRLSDTEWIGETPPDETGTVPDDAAAVPSEGAQLPVGALEELQDPDTGATLPSQPSGSSTQPDAETPQPSATSPTPATTPDREATGAAATRPEAGASARAADESSTPPATPAEPVASSPPPVGDSAYTVHVGSFRHLEQAYQDIATLQKHGFVGRAIKTDLGNKGVWYRVYVGDFSTRSEAEQIRDSILELPEYRYAQVKRIPR